MSNTARKARKAAGIPFQHPVKVPTPWRERVGFMFMQPEKAAKRMLAEGATPEAVESAKREIVAAREFRRAQRRLAGNR
jgi:hypothetical protein